MALSDADGHRPQAASAVIEKAGDSTPTSGFRARLDGLSLFDLVQMECLARARRVIRIASAGRVGYLFFKDGEIFHAATRHLAGERAALEMLGWTDGTFEPCSIAWPDQASIHVGWQGLLLGAATTIDEETAGKLVRLPSRRTSERPPPEAPVKSNSQPPPAGGVHRAVRVDPSGRVLSSAGDATELSGFAAYASRVGELVGQALGLGRFSALDMGFEASRAVLYVEDDGNVVVAEAKNPDDLASVARRAGL